MIVNTYLEPCATVLGEIVSERLRQIAKWGVQNHPDLHPRLVPSPHQHIAEAHASALNLPVAAIARNYCELVAKAGHISWSAILVEEVAEAVEAAAIRSPADLRKELVEVAAVAVAWIEAIDRRAKGGAA